MVVRSVQVAEDDSPLLVDKITDIAATSTADSSSASLSDLPDLVDTVKSVEVESIPNSALWTIHGTRYDLRKFAPHHPGGEHAIMLGQGIDSTILFETHHVFTERHRAVLKRYKYDENADPALVDTTYDWTHTPFYDDVKKAAREYFSPRGDESLDEISRNSKATWAAVGIHGIKVCVLLFVFAAWIHDAPWSSLYVGVTYWLVAGEFGHAGNHFAMSRWPWVNTLSSYFNCLHFQHHCWSLQHVVGHHSYPNILDKDPDMHHFHKDRPTERYMAGFRIHPEEKILPKYARFWLFGVVYHMLATTLAIALVNVPLWVKQRYVEVTPIPPRLLPTIILDRLVVVFAIAWFIVTRDSPTAGFFKVLSPFMVHGVVFSFFSQITHVNEQCMKALETYREKHGLHRVEWATHQVLTASDYCCDSPFVSLLAISLNHQICHHLLPTVHPCHYRALRHILMPIAAKHGIDYESRSNRCIWTAAGATIKWICKLNHSNNQKSTLDITLSVLLLALACYLPSQMR